MTGPDDTEDVGAFASPPCFMHELDPDFRATPPAGDRRTEADVARWRKAERERLIEARRAIPLDARTAMTANIAAGLDRLLGEVAGLTVSLYWPFKAEPDLRPWAAAVIERGATVALPIVVEKAAPLIFRAWRPGDPLGRGVWNIPIPTEEAPLARPDIVIAPLVGFDAARYRLGYGGGFFDRTLAAARPRPRAVGIGYEIGRLATIYPQAYDIPMDAIVTEAGILAAEG